MMFHAPSFALGYLSAVAYRASRRRVRPVLVEAAAVGLHAAMIARAVLARRREDLEDLWAEVEERVAARAHTPAAEPASGMTRGK